MRLKDLLKCSHDLLCELPVTLGYETCMLLFIPGPSVVLQDYICKKPFHEHENVFFAGNKEMSFFVSCPYNILDCNASKSIA
jgi:hypothetical protein